MSGHCTDGLVHFLGLSCAAGYAMVVAMILIVSCDPYANRAASRPMGPSGLTVEVINETMHDARVYKLCGPVRMPLGYAHAGRKEVIRRVAICSDLRIAIDLFYTGMLMSANQKYWETDHLTVAAGDTLTVEVSSFLQASTWSVR